MTDSLSLNTLIPKLINLRTIQSTDTRTWDAIARGELVALSSQWYLPAHIYKDLEWFKQRALRAFAVGRTARKAVIAGRAAARLHGIWVISMSEETVEVIAPNGAVPAKRDRDIGVTYRFAKLKHRDIMYWNGIRLTGVARTIIDICRYHGEVEGIIACDWALARQMDRAQLAYELALLGRRKGVATARKCIAAAISISESPYESFARALLLQAGISEITPQAWVGNYRVDLLVAGFLIIEIDGDVKYAGELRDDTVLQERQREKYLLNQGFRLMRYRPRDMVKDPEHFVAEVRAVLASSPHYGDPHRQING